MPKLTARKNFGFYSILFLFQGYKDRDSLPRTIS